MNIGERIKLARTSKGMSYAQLAETTGLTKATLQRYETGATKKIPVDAISLIEVALHLEKGALMGWTEAPNYSHSPSYDNTHTITLTPHETKVITAYRDKPEMQPAVDTLLGITSDEEYYIPVAARNGKSGRVKVTSSPEERKAALDKELPGVSTPKKPDLF